MISISAAMWIVVYLVIGGLIFWLLSWLIDYCGVPEPFSKIARIVLAILAVLVVIGLLLNFLGGGGQPVFRP